MSKVRQCANCAYYATTRDEMNAHEIKTGHEEDSD